MSSSANISTLYLGSFPSINQHKNDKAIQKLSSGLRINGASDDASGLCISEKMRAQLRGLSQSERNIQDGVSLIQTAEGGLNEIHSLLQRGRELAVQANNDTLTTNDKELIQDEINEINKGIDNIAINTEFNTIKILNSSSISSTNQASASNVIAGLKKGWLEEAEKRIQAAYGLIGTGVSNLNIILDPGTPYGELAHVGGPASNLELHIDLSDFTPATGESGNTVPGPGFYADRVIAHELTHAVMDDALGVSKMNDFHDNNGVWFIEGTAEFIPGADERLKQVIGNGSGIDSTKLANLISRGVDLLNGAAWSGDDQDYSAGYIIVKYINQHLDGGNFSDLMNIIKADSGSATNALKNGIVTLSSTFTSFNDFINKFGNLSTGGAKDYIENHITLNWGTSEVDTGSIKGSDSGGSNLNAEDVINESTSVSKDQPLTGFKVVWPSFNSQNSKPLLLQVGPNSGTNLEVSLVNVTSKTLGTMDIDVVNAGRQSLDIFDSAIETISKNRSYFGAIENRLNHAISITNIAYENLQSAESKIRDTDMSKEIVEFTQTNNLINVANTLLSSEMKNSQKMSTQIVNQTSNKAEDNKTSMSKATTKSSLNQMNRLNTETSKITEQLSSGLRINKAADDAAGLSIREKMRGRIRGLYQADRNIQDGISLAQTAEAGISEIQSIVQRQRELCVRASNDTLSVDDRDSIQKEIDQLNKGINEIANNTHFNTIPLLNIDDTGITSVTHTGIPLSLSVDASGRLGLTTSDGYSSAAEDDNQILIYGNGSTSEPKVMIDGTENSLYNYVSSSTVLNGDTYETSYTIAGIQVKQSVKIVGTDRNMYEIKYDITNTAGFDKNVGFLFNIDTKLGNDDFAPFRINGTPITNEVQYTGSTIPNEFIVYNHTTNQYLDAKGIITGSFDGINIIEDPDKLAIGDYTMVKSWNFTPSGSLGDSGYSLWWNSKTMTTGSTRTVNTFYGLKKPNFTNISTSSDGLKIQLGPNSGNYMIIHRKRITTDVLATDTIKVTSSNQAQAGISIAEDALIFLSSERSRYGSYQNALERYSDFAQNSEENLTAAESRISDADMAKNVLKFAKNNILNQFLLKMFSQSNLCTNDILALLS